MNSLLMDLKYKKIFAVQFAKVTHLIITGTFLLYASSFSHKVVSSSPVCRSVCLIGNQ